MFKKKVFKLFTLFILIILSFTISNKIYGYNLTYKASLSLKDGKYSATIRNFVQASEESIKKYNGSETKKDTNGWVNTKYNQKTKKWEIGNIDGGEGFFSNRGIYFHTNIVTKYEDSFKDNNSYNNIYYDVLEKYIDASSENYPNVTGKESSVKQNQTENFENGLEETIDGIDLYSKRWKIKGGNINIGEYYLSNELIVNLKSIYGEKVCTGTGSKKLRFSFIAASSDSRLSKNSGVTIMKTASSYYTKTVGNWFSGGRGFKESDKWLAADTGTYKPMASVANQYDNILKIPFNELKRNIYVRHIDESGKNIGIQNPSQIVNNKIVTSTGSTVINNKTYQETYDVGTATSAKINKSLTIVKDGVVYECIGVRQASGTTVAVADKNLKDSVSKSYIKPVELTNMNKNVYVVEFKYKKISKEDNIDKRIDGSGTIETKFEGFEKGTDNKMTLTQNCSPKTVYIPSGEQLRPYISKAPSYLPYNITYKLVNDNGTIKYQNVSLDVLTLSNLSINGVSGKNLESVFNQGIGSIPVSYSPDLSYYSGKKNSLPNFNNNIAQIDSNIFNTRFDINSNKYNGLRKPTSTVTYSGKIKVTRNITKTEKINVFTPLNLVTPIIKSDTKVDHSEGTTETSTIQQGTTFTVTPKTTKDTYYSYKVDTSKYLKWHYIVFNFPVENCTGGTPSGKVAANTPIKVSKGGKITAKALSVDDNSLNQLTNKVTVYGVTYNDYGAGLDTATTSKIVQVKQTVCNGDDKVTTGNRLPVESKYVAKIEKTTDNLGRIFDFKITDCNDINFKDIFRKSDSNGNVNISTGKSYFSGIYKWYYTNKSGNNVISDRTKSEIGVSPANILSVGNIPRRTLPIGPYKHDPLTYVQAPKLRI